MTVLVRESPALHRTENNLRSNMGCRCLYHIVAIFQEISPYLSFPLGIGLLTSS